MHSLIKQLLILALFTLLLFSSKGQNIHFNWVKTFGNSNGSKVIIDSNKFVIVTGDFNGTVDFDNGPGVFNMTPQRNDIYITSHDTAGTFLWAKQIGGEADEFSYDMEIDKNGDLLILGLFQSTVDFNPGPGVDTLSTTGGTTFLLKLDNKGNFIWVKKISAHLKEMDIDAEGNIFLAGEFSGTRDFDPGPGSFIATSATLAGFDLAVVKLDNEGNFIWMKQVRNLGSSSQQQNGLECDREGNVYFAGNFTAAMDFDPGPGITTLTSAGSDDAFLLKLNAQGNFAWVKQFGAAGSDKIYGLEVDKDGNVFSTGQFYNSVDFNPGPANYILTGGNTRSCFISKLDRNGDFVFAKSFTGESWGQALAIDSSNNLYVSGGFHYTVDFDPGPGIYNASGHGVYTAKLNDNGDFVWVAPYINTGNNSWETIYNSMKVDIMKNVYLTGVFANTVDWDPNSTEYTATSPSVFGAYIHKLSQCNNTANVIDISNCPPYTLNGITYNSSGVYFQTLTNSVGCDSIIQLIIQRKFSRVNVTTCHTYTWNGKQYTTGGLYRDTLPSTQGCDSVVQLNLTINRIISNANDTACGSYAWNGKLLTNSGMYIDTLPATGGCDSVVNLNLLIKTKPQPFLGNDTVMCMGEAITLWPGSFNAYAWSNNTTAGTLSVTNPGSYWVQVTGANNCTASDTIQISGSANCDCVIDERTKISPNPFRDYLIIDKQPSRCEVRMDLYNTLGQLVAKNILVRNGLNKIPLTRLAAGMYFYKLYSNNNILLKGGIMKQ